ncbi:holo-ACP synthase [Alloscardovia omnicolens]|uniref:holo-ACP synthase n=1 Tax=Alloscardovia omnicolens TaxID=419015 RepID=UPI003A65B1AE
MDTSAQIAGMGHDIVDCAEFAEQLAVTGTRFHQLFSAREATQCRARSRDDADYAQHLAARWAGKEAFLKAWSHALSPHNAMPYTIENFPWISIEILHDAVHRPSVHLDDDVNTTLYNSLRSAGKLKQNDEIHWHISLSHDGGIASAVAIMEIATQHTNINHH